MDIQAGQESLSKAHTDRLVGSVCCDSTGLGVLGQGDVNTNSVSGIASALPRLASQLSGLKRTEGVTDRVPLISVEFDSATFAIKEYDAYTVALRFKKDKGGVEGTRSS